MYIPKQYLFVSGNKHSYSFMVINFRPDGSHHTNEWKIAQKYWHDETTKQYLNQINLLTLFYSLFYPYLIYHNDVLDSAYEIEEAFP